MVRPLDATLYSRDQTPTSHWRLTSPTSPRRCTIYSWAWYRCVNPDPWGESSMLMAHAPTWMPCSQDGISTPIASSIVCLKKYCYVLWIAKSSENVHILIMHHGRMAPTTTGMVWTFLLVRWRGTRNPLCRLLPTKNINHTLNLRIGQQSLHTCWIYLLRSHLRLLNLVRSRMAH